MMDRKNDRSTSWKSSLAEKQTELSIAQKIGTYVRVLVVWFVSLWCGGVSPGLNLFLPMFAQAGLCAEVCGTEPLGCKDQYLALTSVFTMCASVSSLGFLPAGLAFDMLGGRSCGAGGALCVSASACLLALGVVMDSSTVVAIAVLCMDAGALLNNFGFMGLMWHVPEAQGLLLSVACGATQTAAVLPNFLQLVMAGVGLSFPGVLMFYAALTLVCSIVLFFAVPPQDEFFARATFVLGIPVSAPKHTFKSVKTAIKMAWKVCVHAKQDVFLVCLTMGIGNAAGISYFMDAVPFGTALFGDKAYGEQLAVFYTQATMVNSVVASVLMGYLMDYTSLGTASYACFFGVVLIVTLGSEVSYYPQALCAAAQGFNIMISPAIMCRFVALWSPSHRFGMVQGLVVLCYMLLFATFVTVFNLMSAMFDGEAAFTTPMRIFGVFGLVCWGSTSNRLATRKYTTILLERDEEELMEENFGLKTFQDAENVLRMDREEILRILASQDLEVRRQLVDMMKEPDVQLRWAKRAYAQGYELPELAPEEHMYLMLTNLENTLTGFFCCLDEKGSLTPRPSARDVNRKAKSNRRN